MRGPWIEFQVHDGPPPSFDALRHWRESSLYVHVNHAERLAPFELFLKPGWYCGFASLPQTEAWQIARLLDADPRLAELVAMISVMGTHQHLFVLGA